MSDQYEIELSKSEVTSRRVEGCCEYSRYGLKEQVTARTGETGGDVFYINYPSPGYILAHIEGDYSCIILEKLILYKKVWSPSTDPDGPHADELVLDEEARVGAGEVLEIPGNCECDFEVHGYIKFIAPATATPQTSVSAKLIIETEHGKEKINLLLMII